MLSRVDFANAFYTTAYESRSANGKWFKGSPAAITNLSKALRLETKFTYYPNGFMHMMFLDPTGFDQRHYQFSYVRREFLGSIRTWVFDVRPTVSGMGRFYGRIWIEDQDGNIVRFNGNFTKPTVGEDLSKRYYWHGPPPKPLEGVEVDAGGVPWRFALSVSILGRRSFTSLALTAAVKFWFARSAPGFNYFVSHPISGSA